LLCLCWRCACAFYGLGTKKLERRTSTRPDRPRAHAHRPQ
jgi:hypothetical protein